MATSLNECKVSDADVNRNSIERNAPDVLTNSAQENKRVFDAFPQIVATRHNELVQYISDNFTDTNIDEQTKALFRSMGWVDPTV